MQAIRRIVLSAALLIPTAAFAQPKPTPADNSDLAQQIANLMFKIQGDHPGFRPTHAKGMVCHGTFEPSKDAASLSKAAHFQGPPIPLTVRYSDGSPDPIIPDNSPNAGPRGMAIRFTLPDGSNVDIVAMSHNGFVVGNPQDFLELQKSIAATDPSNPHPWPIEAFLGAHPRALKFVTENKVLVNSFANEAFFSNDSFLFTNKDGTKQTGRYKILPIDGVKDLTDDDAKNRSPNYLYDDLNKRLPAEPIKYHLVVQLPNPGDATNDPSLVWPEDRKTIDMGTITINMVVPDSLSAQKALAFDPTNLTDGIEVSDDPFPDLRSAVYALSVQHRNPK